MKAVAVDRKVKAGKWRIPVVFPGLDLDPNFRAIFANDGLRDRVLRETLVNAIPEDLYMYVDAEAGHIVAGLDYLRTGEEVSVYLDILHELVHIRQWNDGRELFDRRYAYVDRPTEVEAYGYVVGVARRLGMSDGEIADYLRVEWTSRKDHERLCRRLGVRLRDSRAH